MSAATQPRGLGVYAQAPHAEYLGLEPRLLDHSVFGSVMNTGRLQYRHKCLQETLLDHTRKRQTTHSWLERHDSNPHRHGRATLPELC